MKPAIIIIFALLALVLWVLFLWQHTAPFGSPVPTPIKLVCGLPDQICPTKGTK